MILLPPRSKLTDTLFPYPTRFRALRGALDQIVQHFVADAVAEVTGRSRRIVPVNGDDGSVRFAVQNRPGSANLGETHAFMDDEKRILVFSEAGGTGRS